MAEGVLATHESLKIALKEYIVAQYLRRTPVLLEALEGRLEQENVLFREPYIFPSLRERSRWTISSFTP